MQITAPEVTITGIISATALGYAGGEGPGAGTTNQGMNILLHLLTALTTKKSRRELCRMV